MALPSSVLAVVLVAILMALSVEESSKACRPKHPGYFLGDGHEARARGCYHSGPLRQVFPGATLVNFRGDIDWELWARQGHAQDIIRKCGKLAMDRGLPYFGLEFYGECYLGDSPDFSQSLVLHADDCAKLCQWDIGGPSAMVVYRVQPTLAKCPLVNVGYNLDQDHWALNHGCYNHKGKETVLPTNSLMNFRRNIDWHEFAEDGHAGSMVKRCGLVALQKGVAFFGIELYGNCFFGNKPNWQVSELACGHEPCYWDVGRKGALMLYQVVGY